MNHNSAIRTLLSLCLCSVLILSPLVASAQYAIPADDLQNGFDPNAILNDRDMFELKMTHDDLRRFLASRGALGSILIEDIDGTKKPPADIIWRVATTYKINPQYLLALLQKEQSLVEDPNPSQRQFDWATGFAVCDSCSTSDPDVLAFKGFANQLEWAAKQHRERYLLSLLAGGTTISGYAPGISKVVSGIPVTPLNNATAMLYTYTPHIHGNLNLWRIWKRWFSLELPDGSVVRAKTSGDMYMIRFGTKRKFRSLSVVASITDPEKMIEVEDTELASYPTGREIAFPNYSLIKTPEGTIYLIVGDTKRHIVDMNVFRSLGFLEDDVIEAMPEDAAQYDTGMDITLNTQFPTGLLARDPAGTVWYLEDGFKRRIPHPAILNIYFPGLTPKPLPQAQFDEMSDAGVYTLRNGELVRSATHPAVYVVENGVLRPIASGEVFEKMGWKWRNVLMLPDGFLEGYVQGQPIDVKPAPQLAPSPEPDLASDAASL